MEKTPLRVRSDAMSISYPCGLRMRSRSASMRSALHGDEWIACRRGDAWEGGVDYVAGFLGSAADSGKAVRFIVT